MAGRGGSRSRKVSARPCVLRLNRAEREFGADGSALVRGVLILGMTVRSGSGSLGSWRGVLIVIAMMPALIRRLFDEETFLARNLPRYVEYQNKMKCGIA
jgi:hypothetical protein